MRNSKLQNGSADISSKEFRVSNGTTTLRSTNMNRATRKQNKGEDARKARKQVCQYV
jgi:hypothetical protein